MTARPEPAELRPEDTGSPTGAVEPTTAGSTAAAGPATAARQAIPADQASAVDQASSVGQASAVGPTLRAEGVVLGYDGRTVIDGLDLTLPAGKVTAIVGPNACGKSTLLRGMARLHPLSGGEVLLGDRDVSAMSRRELARAVGMLPQSSIAPDGVRVAELVARGRYPHQGWFGRHSSDDDAVVASALASTGVADLADRPVQDLSGGQRQRVWIAMVLAQQTDIVLLDEPTTFLDLRHQLDLLDLLTSLNRERGTTIAMVLHELNLAARYAEHLVVMNSGRIVAEGDPREVLTSDVVHGAFDLDSDVVPDPVSGTPMVVPRGRFHTAS